MASGRLGAADLLADTDTEIYSVPSGKVATVSVNFCNRNAAQVIIRLANLDGLIATLSLEDYIIFDLELCNNSPLERSGIVMSAGSSIVVRSDTANVTAQVWGWEEPE